MYIIKENIPGWMSTLDLKILSVLSSFVKPNSTLVELGSFCGKSSWTLSKNLDSTCKLHCVDPWDFNKTYPLYFLIKHKHFQNFVETQELIKLTQLTLKDKSWFSCFQHIMKDCSNVEAYKMYSTEYIPPDNVSAVFLDANHSYDSITNDFRIFEKNNEILLFGDDFEFKRPETRLAISDYFLKNKNYFFLCMPDTKIWVLWPLNGFYSNKFLDFTKKISLVFSEEINFLKDDKNLF